MTLDFSRKGFVQIAMHPCPNHLLLALLPTEQSGRVQEKQAENTGGVFPEQETGRRKGRHIRAWAALGHRVGLLGPVRRHSQQGDAYRRAAGRTQIRCILPYRAVHVSIFASVEKVLFEQATPP